MLEYTHRMLHTVNTSTKPFENLLKQADFDWINELTENYPEAEIYLIGGIVRDIILNRTSSDIDFVIRNIPIETLHNWLASHGTVNLVGKQFGVFKFHPKNNTGTYQAFDIALPRTDHAQGTGGYKDVNTQSDHTLPIEKDLARRDFTINAIAYNINTHTLIDPFNGIASLKNKEIKAVGKPEERFQEDYLRMLRALRFACQLNFTIESKTKNALIKLIPNINTTHNNVRIVPEETIAKEFLKTLIAHPVKTLDTWDEVNAWEHIMPELLELKNSPQHPEFHSEGDVWTHTRLALEKINSPDCASFIEQYFPTFAQERANPHSSNVLVALLLHDIAKPDTLQTPEKDGVDRIRNHEHEKIGAQKARKICERLKLSSPAQIGIDIDHVVWLVKNHLIAGNAEQQKMKPTTIEKYFFANPQYGTDLLTVIYGDGSATLNPNGEPALKVLHLMIDRIQEILSMFDKKTKAKKLPQPLLNGDEIMKHFNLKPGKQIGELLHITREAQLSGTIKTKEDAYNLITKNI